jgi:hypothetical protein
VPDRLYFPIINAQIREIFLTWLLGWDWFYQDPTFLFLNSLSDGSHRASLSQDWGLVAFLTKDLGKLWYIDLIAKS